MLNQIPYKYYVDILDKIYCFKNIFVEAKVFRVAVNINEAYILVTYKAQTLERRRFVPCSLNLLVHQMYFRNQSSISCVNLQLHVWGDVLILKIGG